MAYTKVSGLNFLTGAIQDDTLFYVVQNGESKKITYKQLKGLLKGLDKAGLWGSINPQTQTKKLQNGFYIAETSGTYTNANNIVVTEGYYTILEKNDSGWKIASEVKIPMQDLTPLENRVNTLDGKIQVAEDDINTLESELNITQGKVSDLENKNGGEVEFGNTKNIEGGKVFDYVNNKSITKFNPTTYNGGYPKDALVIHGNTIYASKVSSNTEIPSETALNWTEIKMSADVDQEFDANSNNAIANSTVTPLADVLDFFISKDGKKTIIPTSGFIDGLVKNDGSIDDNPTRYITITDLHNAKKIHFKGYKAVVNAASINLYSTILVILNDNTKISLLNCHNFATNQVITDIILNIPSNAKSIMVCWSDFETAKDKFPTLELISGELIGKNYVKTYIDDKVEEFIENFAVTLDEVNNPKSALSFDKGNDVLKGFFDQIIYGEEIKYTSSKGFLYTNNTTQDNTGYSVSKVHNLPLNRDCIVTGFAMDSKENVATLLGIKDGIITNLILGLSVGDKYTIQVKKDEYDFISICFLNSAPPTIYSEDETIGNIDAKNYVDERFVVLDSFINPTEDVIEEIIMPQAGEISGAIITDGWRQFINGLAYNGEIPITELKGFDRIRIEGDFKMFGTGAMFLGGFKNTSPSKFDVLLTGISANSNAFEIEINHDYEGYAYSRSSATKFYKIRTVKHRIEKDSVIKAIENGVGTGSKISQQSKAKIAYPNNLIELNFETSDALPIAKGTLAKGVLNYTDNAGTSFKKFATLKVQGASSAFYPKKNWTFSLFNKEDHSDDFKLRIGNWTPHSEFVFKSNWIDATHSRNILSNKIWEDIVQSRKYFPKRENEVAYVASNTNVDERFDSGALCHVDGVPAKLFVNGNFYGIGMFNLGKKRENYDLKSSNQNHIQLAAETHANFNSYVADQWEIRNPKTPDANFQDKINAWFASNALTGQAFKDNFEVNHDLNNAIDFFLLAEFIQSPDMYTKNLILTSWDGVKFYFLPYDMDTTFGLEWNGLSFTGHKISIRSTSFWYKFYTVYTTEIKARYKVLRDSGVFTLENVYKHADKMNKTFGVDNYKQEFEAWTQIPSNSIIYTSFPQIYQWTKDRIIWLDSQYI